ncbi:hypothetical protein [Rhizobium mayense]|uniref:Uncharacterized protein n=1 Tax=Rhizobium mayense TaxID=1312184 RepID=A0ABT7K466_9HYPH|nr:hypothetical protein [Rhizobium mayense]MDL2403411.1 hypothetical protein [Rhizobium mayense]
MRSNAVIEVATLRGGGIDEATKVILHDITNRLATVDCRLRLLERQTEAEGRKLIVDQMRHAPERAMSH